MTEKEPIENFLLQPQELVPVASGVDTIPDSELLRRAVENARPRRGPHPRWVAVCRTFGLGATYAQELCQRFGLDPDEEVRPS